jgi:hypothetical protein
MGRRLALLVLRPLVMEMIVVSPVIELMVGV